MLSSISGQNEWWVRQAAPPPPPVVQPGQNGKSDASDTGTEAADPSLASPVGGDTGSPLSSNTSLMLMMFGGIDPAGPTGTAPQSGSTAPATQAQNDAADAQDLKNYGSLLADFQSLIASLTNGTDPASATTSSSPATGSQSTESNGIASGGATMVASASSTQPPPAPGGERPAGSDISSNGSILPDPSWRNGWDGSSGPGSNWQQQSGLAAYAIGNIGPTISTLGTIKA